jgi:hypothetical protein
MGAERQRAEAKHKQSQATQDTPTQDRLQTHPHFLSQGDRRTGNHGQPQTTSTEGQERPRNGARPDTRGAHGNGFQRETEEKARQPDTN